MADISISVTLDNAPLQTSLNKAGQDVQKFISDAKSKFDELSNKLKDLTNNINPLQGGILKLVSAFSLLKAVDFAKDAAEWANTMDSVAKSVGMTVPQILELQTAVTKAGGTAQAASRGIEMFYMKLDQARQGGTAQQYAFERLGISLKDLATMDDRDLFRLTIQRLADMPRSAASSRIEVELLSKSFRGIPISEINAELDKMKGKFDEQGAVVAEGAEAWRHFLETITNLKLALLTIFQPIFEQFGKLNLSVDDFVVVLRKALEIIVAIVAIRFAGELFLIVDATFAAIKGVRALIITLEALSVAEGVASLGIGTLIQWAVKLGIAGAAAYGAVSIIDDLDKKLEENKGKNLEAAKAAEEKTKADNKQSTIGQQVWTAYARLNAAIKEQTSLFKDNMDAQIKKIQLGAEDAGMSEEQKARRSEELRMEQEFTRKIEETRAKLKEAQAARPDSDQAKTTGALKTALDDLVKSQADYVSRAGEAAAAKARENNIDQMGLLLKEDQIKIQKTLADIQINIDELTMTNDQKKIANIEKQTNEYIKLATEKRRSELGTNTTDQQLGEDELLQNIIKGIREKSQEVITATKTEIEESRKWNTGWKSAFDQYVEDATNAATLAKDVFNSVVGSMNSALDNFVMTGKFNFSSLATSIIQDLLKIQLKASLAGVLKAGASGLSSMFGGAFADGGNIPSGKFGLVGEAGPELVAGPATVTSAKDTAGMIGGGDTNNHYYNIQAVDSKSVAQLFAENRMTMFGMVEQARRELPMRTR